MFTCLDQTGTMGIRLPEAALVAFLKKYKTTLFQSYGVVKKDWASVPDKLLPAIGHGPVPHEASPDSSAYAALPKAHKASEIP